MLPLVITSEVPYTDLGAATCDNERSAVYCFLVLPLVITSDVPYTVFGAATCDNERVAIYSL